MDRSDVLALAGGILVAVGIGLVYVPAAIVVVGLVFLAAARQTPEAG